MKCVRCEKETGHAKVQYCKECFFIEFMWQFRNNPFVYEDELRDYINKAVGGDNQ
jgi:hypothetical protein